MYKNQIYLLILLTIFLFADIVFAIGQNRFKIDSLLALIKVNSNTVNLAENYNELAGYYSDYDIDSAIYFANIALQTAKQSGNKSEEAESNYILSYFNDRNGKTQEAIDFLEKAIEIYKEIGDSSYLAGCYNNLGVLYSYGTDQKTSLMYFIKAMNLAEKINETFALSEAYSNIGSFYEYLKEYSSALKYYNKALEIDLKINNVFNLAYTYLTIGNINIKLQRYDSARDSLLKAQELFTKIKDCYRQAELCIIMGDYYLETNQLDSANQQIVLAKKLTGTQNFKRLNADILFLEGNLCLKKNKYAESLKFFDEALVIYNKLNIYDRLYDLYSCKGNAYSQLGKYEKAFEMLQMTQNINDEFKPNEIAKILSEFENSEALKEEKAKLLLEQEIIKQKNEKEVILIRAKLQGAILSIIFLVTLTALVVYLYILKQKNNSLLSENYRIIHEQKLQLEENYQELKLKETKLTQLNATKDKFFSIIAHDLKNPFNVMIGLSDIVITDPEMRNSEEFEEIIDGIFQTAKSGYNLLENLLEWARSQTGEVKFEPNIISLNDIISQNLTLFCESAKSKSIELKNFIPADEKVFADFNMINFIVRNLLNNAIKFSYPNGKIEFFSEQKNDFVVITVKDYGIGMIKETIEKLFRIESTSPKPGTANETGTGLGLIICKEFIEKNGGEIWVESELGKGSCFHFSLPDDGRKEFKN